LFINGEGFIIFGTNRKELTLKKNICIITSSLGGGGAERVAAQQSKIFQDLGFNVYIITIVNSVTYPFSGKLLNLGLELNGKDSIKAKVIRHIKIRRFIKKNKIDIIVDHRARLSVFTEIVFSYFSFCNKPIIYNIHNYKTETYIPGDNFILNRIFAKANKIVTVSKAIEKKIINEYGFKNVQTIYNPVQMDDIDLKEIDTVDTDFNYILFYGRLLDKAKNIKLLIDAYQKSILSKSKIKLLIMGNGKDKEMLVEMVNKLSLSEMILFKPFVSNPFSIVKNAKFTMLTSRHEGFPMVIIESLACGTPIISVDCKSGPNEIIRNKFNGLLVENNNVKALTEAIDLFVLNQELYNYCKKNAKESIAKLDIEIISKEWLNILK